MNILFYCVERYVCVRSRLQPQQVPLLECEIVDYDEPEPAPTLDEDYEEEHTERDADAAKSQPSEPAELVQQHQSNSAPLVAEPTPLILEVADVPIMDVPIVDVPVTEMPIADISMPVTEMSLPITELVPVPGTETPQLTAFPRLSTDASTVSTLGQRFDTHQCSSHHAIRPSLLLLA
jgi:hypothetical protein